MYNENEILILDNFGDKFKITKDIKKVIFTENFQKISYEFFTDKNIEAVKLPNTIVEIQANAFTDNKIKNLELNENLKIIERGAFKKNCITDIKFPSTLEDIGAFCFKENNLEDIKLNENLKRIGNAAFQNNKLKKLVMNDNLELIEPGAFSFNEIEEIKFNKKIKKIFFATFEKNNISNLIIPETIIEIHDDAFAHNNITNLVIPNTLLRIESCAFMKNKISNLKIGSGLNVISNRTFWGNELTNLEIPKNIKTIKSYAFAENKISTLILNEGLEEISMGAFIGNNLTSVKLPSTIKVIGKDVFNPCDVYIDDVKVEKELVEKFGTELILKIAQIKKIANINYDNISKESLRLIPLDNDSLKGLSLNSKKFNANYDNIKNKISYDAYFKLGYSLGAFKGNDAAYNTIFILGLLFNKEELEGITNKMNLTKFDSKFADTINNEIMNSGNNNRLIYLIPTFYNNIDRIKKGVLKYKENKIAKLNVKVNDGHLEYKKELENLKKNKKKLTLDDVDLFILTGLFNFSEENKELFRYAHIFNGNVEKEDIPAIEDIYSKAKKLKETNFKIFEEKIGDYRYSWVDNTDPINLVLGYLVNCCAKYKGAGEDIMVQSMTNPNIKNLVIYKGAEVVAKSTAFYNQDYILCNNIEVSESYTLKYNDADKKELLNVFSKAITEQSKLLDVNESRVGLLRNDLLKQIVESDFEILHNQLLSNYRFNNYEGDANDPMFGQALIYKK